jgi:hypothetical protein
MKLTGNQTQQLLAGNEIGYRRKRGHPGHRKTRKVLGSSPRLAWLPCLQASETLNAGALITR